MPNIRKYSPQHWKKSGTDLTPIDVNARVGIGTPPTARLHLKAGTASAGTSPLKFTEGVNLLTPEAGSMEYDGKKFYLTCLTKRKTISRSSDALIVSQTVNNTTDEITVWTAPLTANSISVGSIFVVEGSSQFSTVNAATTLTLRIKGNGATLTTLTSTAGVVSNKTVHFWNYFTIRTIGVAGTLAANGYAMLNDKSVHSNSQDVVINTTAINNIAVTVQWSNAAVGDSITLDQCFLTEK